MYRLLRIIKFNQWQTNSSNRLDMMKQTLMIPIILSKNKTLIVKQEIIFCSPSAYVVIVCVREQHYVSIFLTRLWSVCKPMLFWYKDSLVTNQQKCHFSAVSLHFCLPFGFVFMRIRNWESWNSRILYQKAVVCAQTINKWRKSKRCVVLLGRQMYLIYKLLFRIFLIFFFWWCLWYLIVS